MMNVVWSVKQPRLPPRHLMQLALAAELGRRPGRYPASNDRGLQQGYQMAVHGSQADTCCPGVGCSICQAAQLLPQHSRHNTAPG
jgi:hypothetical protein